MESVLVSFVVVYTRASRGAFRAVLFVVVGLVLVYCASSIFSVYSAQPLKLAGCALSSPRIDGHMQHFFPFPAPICLMHIILFSAFNTACSL